MENFNVWNIVLTYKANILNRNMFSNCEQYKIENILFGEKSVPIWNCAKSTHHLI